MVSYLPVGVSKEQVECEIIIILSSLQHLEKDRITVPIWTIKYMQSAGKYGIKESLAK